MSRQEEEYVARITKTERGLFPVVYRRNKKGRPVDYAPVKGFMVIKPYGYAIWENMQRELDKMLKASGHSNAYFPLFIPESLLQKEAEHVEGFAPEVAWVTAGANSLLERKAVRPTSEAIVCSMYSKWIRSYRDPPILYNQWCNVVRWEKAQGLSCVLRSFCGRKAIPPHATEDEAEEETLRILEIYRDFAENTWPSRCLPARSPGRKNSQAL